MRFRERYLLSFLIIALLAGAAAGDDDEYPLVDHGVRGFCVSGDGGHTKCDFSAVSLLDRNAQGKFCVRDIRQRSEKGRAGCVGGEIGAAVLASHCVDRRNRSIFGFLAAIPVTSLTVKEQVNKTLDEEKLFCCQYNNCNGPEVITGEEGRGDRMT